MDGSKRRQGPGFGEKLLNLREQGWLNLEVGVVVCNTPRAGDEAVPLWDS